MEFLSSLHNKVIHFPIAAFILYPIWELLFLITKKEFFNKIAYLFLCIGIIGALLAVLTGNQAYEMAKHILRADESVFNEHKYFANISLWYFSILLIGRFLVDKKKMLKGKIVLVFFLLALLGAYFVYHTGNYGGKLSDLL